MQFQHYLKPSPWIKEEHYMEVKIQQFYRNNTVVSIPGKFSEIIFYVLLFSNPGKNVLQSIKSRGPICPPLYQE